jgi:DNA-binding transcriptional ArsR family regulator
MHSAANMILKTLADPTRRAIFERLARDGEQTVLVLTGHSGVSQPAASKHLAASKLAGLVRDRHQGGFRPEETGNYQGANYGWQKYVAGLERVAAGLK